MGHISVSRCCRPRRSSPELSKAMLFHHHLVQSIRSIIEHTACFEGPARASLRRCLYLSSSEDLPRLLFDFFSSLLCFPPHPRQRYQSTVHQGQVRRAQAYSACLGSLLPKAQVSIPSLSTRSFLQLHRCDFSSSGIKRVRSLVEKLTLVHVHARVSTRIAPAFSSALPLLAHPKFGN